jgi:hypothetical protein
MMPASERKSVVEDYMPVISSVLSRSARHDCLSLLIQLQIRRGISQYSAFEVFLLVLCVRPGRTLYFTLSQKRLPRMLSLKSKCL